MGKGERERERERENFNVHGTQIVIYEMGPSAWQEVNLGSLMRERSS